MVFSAAVFASSASSSDGNHGFLPCDVNDDGSVNMKDILILRLLIAGAVNAKEIVPPAADADGNGNIDLKDILYLRKVLVGDDEPAGNNEDGAYRIGKITVGGRNIARYSILIPDDADECMQYSSQLLRMYISSACGISLNVTNTLNEEDSYYIEYRSDGDDEYSLGDEGYDILVKDDGNIVLTCGAKRGALYATYYFLEKLIGWRFLNGDMEYLYEKDNVDIPIGYTAHEVPVFSYRGVNMTGSTSDDFAALRLNAVDSEGSRSAAAAQYGGGVGNLYLHGHSYEYQMSVGMKLEEQKITDLDSPEAMKIFSVYAYNNSESDHYRDTNELATTQPCLTSDVTFERIMAFNYLLYKKSTEEGKYPGVSFTMISCSPNDTERFCFCEKCKEVYSREGSLAGTVIRMSNRVAEAQREFCPGVGVYTIAYWDARKPPVYTAPEEDVCICFCISGCNNHTYDHPEECTQSGGNPRYPYKVWDNEKQQVVRAGENISNDVDLDFYKGWTELTDNTMVWYYSTNFIYNIAPSPNIFNIYNDIKYVAEKGSSGVYFEGSSYGFSFELLKGYLAARMLWDPLMSEEDFEKYLDEYLMIYYGDGWSNVKEYLCMQDNCGNANGCFMNNFDYPWDMYNKEYYRDNFDRFTALFDKAEEMAEGEQKEHVRDARIHVLFLGLSATYDKCFLNGTQSEKEKYRKLYSELWNDLRYGDYCCVSYCSGTAGLDNFPKSPNDIRDTMGWVSKNAQGEPDFTGYR